MIETLVGSSIPLQCHLQRLSDHLQKRWAPGKTDQWLCYDPVAIMHKINTMYMQDKACLLYTLMVACSSSASLLAREENDSSLSQMSTVNWLVNCKNTP